MVNQSPDNEPTISERESEPRPLVKWGWLRALLFFIAFIAVSVIVAVTSSILLSVSGHSGTTNFDSPITTVFEGASLLISFLLVLLFRRIIDRRSVVSLGFSFSPRFRKDLIWGVVFGIGLQLVIFGSLWVTGQIQVTGVEFVPGSLVILLLTLIFAAVQEEIVMRGYMLSNMMESTNKYLALVLVSVIFAGLHSSNPDASLAGVANILLAGLLLGVYYIHRKNLWFPIGLHIAWNYFEGPVLGSPVSGMEIHSIVDLKFVGSPLLTGGKFGFEASVVAALFTLIAILLVHFAFRKKPSAPQTADRTQEPGRQTQE